MRVRSGVFLLVGLAVSASCERASPPPVADTIARAEPQAAATPAPWTGAWAPALGQILLVPSDTDNTAILVYPGQLPDTGRRPTVDLLTGGGQVSAHDVQIVGQDSMECGGAPVMRLASATFGTWAIGMNASAKILQGDSLEGLASGDSSRLVTRLARLASTIASNERTRFTGLPFSVVRARRYTVGNARLIAAHLVRRLPQESAPLEERTFLIAERSLTGDSLVIRYSDRSSGTEETTEHFEVHAAFDAPGGLLMLLARDTASATRYQILERARDGTWRVRWTRPLSC